MVGFILGLYYPGPNEYSSGLLDLWISPIVISGPFYNLKIIYNIPIYWDHMIQEQQEDLR